MILENHVLCLICVHQTGTRVLLQIIGNNLHHAFEIVRKEKSQYHNIFGKSKPGSQPWLEAMGKRTM